MVCQISSEVKVSTGAIRRTMVESKAASTVWALRRSLEVAASA